MQPSTCAMPDAKRRAAAEDANGKGGVKTKNIKILKRVALHALMLISLISLVSELPDEMRLMGIFPSRNSSSMRK